MSLDEFQARYTSEDNSSFTQILEDENARKKERYGWAWDAQRRVEGQRRKMIEGREKGRERGLIEGASVPGVKERLVVEAPKPPSGLLTAPEEETEGGDKKEDEKGEDAEEDEGKGKEVVLAEAKDSTEGRKVDVFARKKDTRPAGVDGWNFKVRSAINILCNFISQLFP